MRIKYACVRDGHVIEIQYLTDKELKEFETLYDQVVKLNINDGDVDIGYAYDGDTFYRPTKGSH
jgi:hypothetical protein